MAAPAPAGEQVAQDVGSDTPGLRDDLADARPQVEQSDAGNLTAVVRKGNPAITAQVESSGGSACRC